MCLVTDTSKPPGDNVPDESDEMYECAEPGTGSVDGVPTLEYLTKITKPDDIKGVIKTGRYYFYTMLKKYIEFHYNWTVCEKIWNRKPTNKSQPKRKEKLYRYIQVGKFAMRSLIHGLTENFKFIVCVVLCLNIQFGPWIRHSVSYPNIGDISSGFLNKRRKEGKVYIGSKFQKRYCVVRNHIMYYFKDKKSLKQQGSILLPNYKVAVANKKGREFILTLDGQRPFQVLDL